MVLKTAEGTKDKVVEVFQRARELLEECVSVYEGSGSEARIELGDPLKCRLGRSMSICTDHCSTAKKASSELRHKCSNRTGVW